MSARTGVLVAAGVGLVWLALAAVLFLAPLPWPFPRWIAALPFLAMAAVNLVLATRIAGERVAPDAVFTPVDESAGVRTGTSGVRQLAEALQAELAGQPYQVATAPDAVRVTYDTGVYRSFDVQRRVRWASTLTATSDPRVFRRMDRLVDESAGGGRRQRRVTVGEGSVSERSWTFDRDGTVDKQTRSTRPAVEAIARAAQRAGVRVARSSATWMAIVNGAFGALLGLGGAAVAVALVL